MQFSLNSASMAHDALIFRVCMEEYFERVHIPCLNIELENSSWHVSCNIPCNSLQNFYLGE